MTLRDTYRASLVRRWHANPDMSGIHDEIGAHSGRMAMMLVLLWPDSSVQAITYALSHDLGEAKTGDIPFEFKDDNPDVAMAESAAGAKHIRDLGFEYSLTNTEISRVKLCDRLDAYLTVQHHKPHLLARQDWQEARALILGIAERLGVALEVREVVV